MKIRLPIRMNTKIAGGTTGYLFVLDYKNIVAGVGLEPTSSRV